MKKTVFVFFVLSVMLLTSCKNENDKLLVDLSNTEKPDVKIKRYEKALFNLDLVNLAEELEGIKEEYKFFLGDDPTDSMALFQLQGYLSDPLILDVYKSVDESFKDISFIEEDLSKAFQYYKYYYPDAKIPQVYTYVSGLDYENPVKYIEDSILVIALDMYLGEDFKYYPRVGIPQYKIQGFQKSNIVVDCMKVIAASKIYDVGENQKLIDYMTYHGKMLFFVDAMLPAVEDSIKMVYTPKQMEWMNESESEVWSYFIEQDLLYTSDLFIINKFIGDAPFTAVFTNNSAPRVGGWLGRQIVRKYMLSQEKMDFNKLFTPELDGQTLLNKSKYKPGK